MTSLLTLTPDNRRELRELLYPHFQGDQLKLLLADAQVDTGRIEMTNEARSTWHSVLEHCNAQGEDTVRRLLEAAWAMKPALGEALNGIAVRIPLALAAPPVPAAASRDSVPGAKTKIRILFIGTDPPDVFENRPRITDEANEIQAALRKSEMRDRFELRPIFNVPIQDVISALDDWHPDIVHYSGHGQEERGIRIRGAGERELEVKPQVLAELFEIWKDCVRCVVLNACNSHTAAKAVSKHIDFVVGMSTRIGDEDGIRFAVTFYSELGRRGVLDQPAIDGAFKRARVAYLADAENDQAPVLEKRGRRRSTSGSR